MFSPSLLKRRFEDDLKRLNAFGTVIEVTGVYYDQKKPSYSTRKFGDIFYDRLKDCKTDDVITLLVPVDKKALLTDGHTYKLACLTQYKTKTECTADLHLHVLDVISQGEAVNTQKQQTLKRKGEILQIFHARTQINTSVLLKEIIRKNERPVIALVMGKTSETLRDIRSAIGGYWDKYIFEEFPINIKSEQEIIGALQKINENKSIHAAVIFRGGGASEDLTVFDSLEIAEASLKLNCSLLNAIGHADNEPFIQRISNRSFITPTDFGYYLKDIFTDSGKEEDLSHKEREISSEQRALHNEKARISSLETELSRKLLSLQERENKLRDLALKNEGQNVKNHDLQKDYELYKSKTRTMAVAFCVAVLLISLILGAVSYFLTGYFFASSPIIQNEGNSNISNAANSPNKEKVNKTVVNHQD